MKTTGKTAPTPRRRGELSAKDAAEFLSHYQQAWQPRNAELAAGLFTRDAQYWQGPFGEPITGREAIHDYWKSATERQEDIHFTVTNSFRSGYYLAAEWTCTYRDRSSGERRELAGMFLADFYGKQVRNFREYWVSRTIARVAGAA